MEQGGHFYWLYSVSFYVAIYCLHHYHHLIIKLKALFIIMARKVRIGWCHHIHIGHSLAYPSVLFDMIAKSLRRMNHPVPSREVLNLISVILQNMTLIPLEVLVP